MTWPDWRLKPVAIIASGPSTASADLTLLKNGFTVLAIKTNVDLCPWADACYGCDGDWWIDRNGLPEFQGRKFTNDGPAKSRFNLEKIKVHAHVDKLLFKKPGIIGGGGCSGFQCINLAVQFGARRIMLVGFDMHPEDKHDRPHWYGRNAWPGSWNPSEKDYVRWRGAIDGAADELNKRRIFVVNASLRSALQNYPKARFDMAAGCLRD